MILEAAVAPSPTPLSPATVQDFLLQVLQTSTLPLNLELAAASLQFARFAYVASFPYSRRPDLSTGGKERATAFDLSYMPASSRVVYIFQLKII